MITTVRRPRHTSLIARAYHRWVCEDCMHNIICQGYLVYDQKAMAHCIKSRA